MIVGYLHNRTLTGKVVDDAPMERIAQYRETYGANKFSYLFVA